MDLSALSSKLLPGFTALGFREERRSRGEHPRGPGSPCGRHVRAWFGTSSYRSGPGKCWESGAHRAGGQVPPLPLGGRGLHVAAACVCGLRFLQQAVTLHLLEGSRDCLQRGPCAKGGRTRGPHAGLPGLCGSCLTSPSSEDAAWAWRGAAAVAAQGRGAWPACARSLDDALPRPPSHLPVRCQYCPVHAQQLSVRRLEVRRGGAAVLGLRRRDGCAVRAEVGGGAALAGRAGLGAGLFPVDLRGHRRRPSSSGHSLGRDLEVMTVQAGATGARVWDGRAPSRGAGVAAVLKRVSWLRDGSGRQNKAARTAHTHGLQSWRREAEVQVRAGQLLPGPLAGVQTAVPRTLPRLPSAHLRPELPSSGDTKVRPPPKTWF